MKNGKVRAGHLITIGAVSEESFQILLERMKEGGYILIDGSREDGYPKQEFVRIRAKVIKTAYRSQKEGKKIEIEHRQYRSILIAKTQDLAFASLEDLKSEIKILEANDWAIESEDGKKVVYENEGVFFCRMILLKVIKGRVGSTSS